MSSRPSRLLDWLDERTGIRELVRSHLTDYEVPGAINHWYALGFVLMVFIALQFASGFLLLIYYVPDAERAFESVERIMNDVPFGWLIRLVHVHGANAMVVVLMLHMLSVLAMSAYKPPRELHWVVGCLLLFTTLGLCFTGTLLPWSQLSYWATTVGLNVAGNTPWIGPTLQGYLQGGEAVGPATLGRAFAFHASLLPALLVVLLVLHLYLVRYVGVSTPPARRSERSRAGTRRFFPDVALHDLAVTLALLTVFFAVLFFAPHLTMPAEAFEKADPFVTPTHVRPEWYFLAPFAMLRLIPNATVGILVQGIAVTALILLPFLDRGERRHILRRPFFLAAVVLAVSGYLALTLYGALA